ncbi:DsbA family protein [Bacillus sp. ISL-47]|uniref:DsbA family oxidoreductase n=1 Tax=Bacillus sp. ISL-47 TaxID=2819130 RepID=UPI001BEC70A5|nr:DsbA family protein [Pseudomonas sp. ISL-84]
MAEVPLNEAIKGKDVEVEWMPYELRPYPNETLKPEGDYLQSTWKNFVYPMADQFGVKIVLPHVSPQPHTHLAFEGFQFAKEHGKGNEYNHRMFTAFFQDELDIGNIEVLTKVAAELSLDQNAFQVSLETRKYKDVHKEALRHAYNEAEIQAVPTFKIGNTILSGARQKEMIEKAIEEEMIRKNGKSDSNGFACGPEGCS